MSAYIDYLNKQKKQMGTAEVASLSQRFEAWFNRLPEIAKSRPFAMSEFEAALKTQGKYISPVLLRFGFKRLRKWSSDGQYNRYWIFIKS